MLVKDRHSGGRNWTPGVFATFWILLAAFSAAYLFRVVSEPMPARTDTAQANASEGAAATAPPASNEQTAALAEASQARELAELKTSLRDLSQQVTELSARLKPIEKVLGPVAMAPPGGAVTTSPPSPEAALPAEKPADQAKAPDTKPANGHKPSEKPADQAKAPDNKPVNPPKPPEKPAEQAKAPDNKPADGPKPAEKPVEVAKAPDKPADTPGAKPSEEIPPSVTVEAVPDEKPEEKPAAPMQVTSNEPTGAPSPGSPSAAGAPSPGSTETANLSAPIPIPPGTTRFGIEIGSVDKQDGLRPMWRDLLTNHAALVAGLQARRVLAPDKKWRLVAGPFGNVAEATQACGLFKKASLPCDPTVFAGDQL